LAVYSLNALPVTSSKPIPTNVNDIATRTMANWNTSMPMFVADGSAGDPASLGIPILLANATVSGTDYTAAVNAENTFLFETAPRTSDGAVSHRVNEVQLWSDFIAM
jgi:hypothetical protein